MAPTDVAALGREVTIIDLRDIDAYNAGHIAGALHISIDALVSKPAGAEPTLDSRS